MKNSLPFLTIALVWIGLIRGKGIASDSTWRCLRVCSSCCQQGNNRAFTWIGRFEHIHSLWHFPYNPKPRLYVWTYTHTYTYNYITYLFVCSFLEFTKDSIWINLVKWDSCEVPTLENLTWKVSWTAYVTTGWGHRGKFHITLTDVF